jgi:ribonuclease PH
MVADIEKEFANAEHMTGPTPSTPRRDGRLTDELRPISIQRHYTRTTPGSVLIRAGDTVVLCTASVEETLPPWMKKDETRGWVTAEYNMLPGSTAPRKPRERAGKVDGRTTEIQRLVGRSLRAVVNLEALGPRMITVDCDVLQADGGTRTLSITGGFIALADAVASLAGKTPAPKNIFRTSVAAISLGLVDDRLLLDLDYSEDSRAQVDCNIVMTGSGEFVEIQGTAEGRTFTQAQFDAQLKLAREGITRIAGVQREALGAAWPL